MKSQISRITLQPEKRYSGVYQQQGRMITDADWNEASDLEKQRLADAFKDAVASGAPRTGGLAVVNRTTLRPGVLYVDGILARLPGDPAGTVSYQSQPDFPEVILPPAGDFTLYADVWERTVTSLEDPRLVDPGLHGADTCTRTQTMLQIKACPGEATDPTTAANNPAIGNARLSAKLRQVSTGADLCDPCADEIDVDERVGNYLFRVEVHDVRRSGSNTIVELKWSRDNGAEQFAVDGAPADFQQGPWTFEFFDDACEKHLGVHLAPGFTPRRGQLVAGYTVPTSGPRTYARQWDGHCQIDLTSKALLAGGQDRGVPLTTSGSETAPGFVKIAVEGTSTNFSVNLDLLELTLELRQGTTDRVFVAGDHWLAEVREAVRSSGEQVLGEGGAGVPPGGIRHHYLKLASFNPGGALNPQSDEERRRLQFLPLTDLEAANVEFTNHCPAEVTLFAGARNVQQALDALCSIAADDIAWTAPTCPAPSVASLLQTIPGWSWAAQDGDASRLTVNDALTALLCKLDAARLPYTTGDCGATGDATVRSLLGLAPGSRSVAEVLDALLCNLRASDVPLDKSATICSTLNAPSIVTVQDALKALCDRPTDGCSRTIRNDDELKEALESSARDISLCLLPNTNTPDGSYTITGATLKGKRSVKIEGTGASAAIINCTGPSISVEARDIHLEGAGFTFALSGGQLILQGNNISVQRCSFRRTGASKNVLSMIQIEPSGSEPKAFLQDNKLSTPFFAFSNIAFNAIVPTRPEFALLAPVRTLLLDTLQHPNLLIDETTFESRADAIARLIRAVPADTRDRWADFLGPFSFPGFRSAGKEPGQLWSWTFDDDLNSGLAKRILQERVAPASMSSQQAREAAAAAIFASLTIGHNIAVGLTSTAMSASLVDNRIVGDVIALPGALDTVDLGTSIKTVSATPWLTAGAGQLNVRGNRLQRLSFQALQTAVGEVTGNLGQPVAGFARVSFSDNQVLGSESALVGTAVEAHGNDFVANLPGLTILALRASVVGNTAPSKAVTVRHKSEIFREAANAGFDPATAIPAPP